MADYLTFEGIYQAVMKAIGDAQYSRSDEVKAVVNMIYLNEICQCDELYPLFWLLEGDDTIKTKTRATITGITAANPVVVTAVAHGFATGDLITIYGVSGMTEVNYRTFYATRMTADTIGLKSLIVTDINGAAYTAYTSGGYVHHRGVSITDLSCKKVLSVNWHGYNKGLSFIGMEQLEAESAWWDDSLSRPLKIMNRRTYP